MAQLITAAQDLTAGWVDLGAEQNMASYTRCAVWINLDINDSTNARIRALAKVEGNATREYVLPIRVVGAGDVKVRAEYIEFDTDADQQMILEVDTGGLIPIVQFQIQTGVAGAAPGQIDNADITFSSY